MRKIKRSAALTLVLCILCSLLCPAASAAEVTDWFLVRFPDPHFNLANEPNRVATVEEFITYITVKAYEPKGSANTPATDKNGAQPSAWCAKYVQSEVDKGTLKPKEISYTEPATVAFAAKYLSNCKGQYQYDYENNYNFTNTDGLTPEQVMYLNVAVDKKLIPYTNGMSAKKTITRAEMNNYLPNKPIAQVSAPTPSSDGGMKEIHAYFTHRSELSELKKHGNTITMVSFHLGHISSLGANEGNQFLLDYLNADETRQAIEYCKQNGITPLFSVSNFGNGIYDSPTIERMLSTEANQNACVNEIMAKTLEYGFKGVNIGFEFVNPACRNSYVSFIKKLNQALDKQGLVLMNTVGAYITASGAGEDASFYDYEALGELSDFIHIILYDDHSDTAYMQYKVQPGTMSNLVYIDRVLKYATHCMPAGKILIGLSSFGVDYNTTKHTAYDGKRPELLTHASAGITNTTDGSMGGTFNYTAADGAHTVYLETDEGIKTRLYKMYRYGLCGASVFFLGSDHPSLYNDAAALSTNRVEVMNAAKAGIIPVNRRNMYKNAISRAEFCDLIVSMITSGTGSDINSFLTQKGVSRKAGQFSDTSSDNVLCAAALGIVNGKGAGTFSPNAPITRQEAAAMLSRLAECMDYKGTSAGVQFNDTKSLQSWAQEAIAKVSGIADPTNNKRVMNGTGSGVFSPYKTYTREQAYMTMIRLYNAIWSGK